MSDKYEKLFIVLNEDDMQKLKDGRPVHVFSDIDDHEKPITIFTEKGFKKFEEWWDGELED